MEHASPHVSSPPVADKASHGRSPSGTHHASGGLSMCKRTPMPLDWMHTGGGGPGSWPSPVDRSSHGPVYGLPPRSTRWAFSWRPLCPAVSVRWLPAGVCSAPDPIERVRRRASPSPGAPHSTGAGSNDQGGAFVIRHRLAVRPGRRRCSTPARDATGESTSHAIVAGRALAQPARATDTVARGRPTKVEVCQPSPSPSSS